MLLPSKYNGLTYGAYPVIALSIIVLFYLLPVFFLVILVLDIVLKRYRPAVKNILVAVLLFIGCYCVRNFILEPYIYDQSEESHLPAAMPPLNTR